VSQFIRLSGRIQIDPPLPWSAIKTSKFLPRAGRNVDVVFDLDRLDVETDDGTLSRKSATGVVPTDTGSGVRNNKAVRDLQELIDTHGAGRTFSGHIEATGEDHGDFWRLAVVGGTATKVLPLITWPSGG
jgi:hypothetical protein